MSNHQQKIDVKLGIIGGTGFDAWGEDENKDTENTPAVFQMGSPSAAPLVQSIEGTRCISMLRHGKGHLIPPHQVPYGANIAALKECGVTDLVAICAVGSLRDTVRPGEFVLVTQYIDRTKGTRSKTYFESNGIVAHVSLAEPTCKRLGEIIKEAAKEVPNLVLHTEGTLVCIEGPQYSTRAESQMYCQMGAEIIGMTTYTEACFAREAQMCYANVAMVTDYDCYDPMRPHVTSDMVVRVMKENAHKATQLQAAIARKIKGTQRSRCSQGCDTCLAGAVCTSGLKGRSEELKKYTVLDPSIFDLVSA